MAPSTALAVRASIPPALAEAGVQMVEHDGWRAIEFPDELRKKFNPLQPVSSFAQADPMWTPSVRLVKIDPTNERLTYKGQKEGERALAKPALYLLAEAGGIVKITTSPLERKFLKDDEIGWQATVYIRRSDGTMTEHQGSRIMSKTDERTAIEEQVRSAQWTKKADVTEAKIVAYIRGRIAKEADHWSAKCETKAILRAIRGVLQIPHSFTAEELGRPFVVVGYSMTPDYSDPEVRRMLVESGIGATSRLYGTPPDEDAPHRALGAGTDAASGADLPPIGHALGEVAPETRAAAVDAAQPEPDEQPDPDDEPEAETPDASGPGAFVMGGGKHGGKTIAQIFGDPEASGYVEWLATNSKNDGYPSQAAARAFLAARS